MKTIILAFLVISATVAISGAQISSFSHIIIVVQENRTPDNLFQGLCGEQRRLCPNPYNLQDFGFNSKGVKVGLAVTPLGSHDDPDHDHSGFVALCDFDSTAQQCKMDGGDKVRCYMGKQIGHCSFQSVDPSDIQPYLTLAQQFGWANYMYSTSQGGSFPGHQFLFGGTSAPSADADAAGKYADEFVPFSKPSGCVAAESSYVVLITPTGDGQMYPCFERQTLPDILPADVTWKYYSSSPGWDMWVPPNAIRHICQPNQAYGGKCIGSEFVDHVDTRSADILKDIGNCRLPNVSWVIPTGQNSDHPGSPYNIGGPSWVASIVNAVGGSTGCDNHKGYWNDTAIIVTWDDFGGFYDHEPPPILAQPQGDYQLGARVPLVFISAYTPVNYIDNNRQDFGSILRFVERNFGIQEGALNFADARSPNDLTTFFNLNLAPRNFVGIPAPLDGEYFLNDKSPPEDPDDD